MPWRDGGSPVVIEVSAAGVVDGTTVVIGPPAKARQLGELAREPPERLPAEAVEHQQDGGPGPGHGGRHPLDGAHSEQGGDHSGDVGS